MIFQKVAMATTSRILVDVKGLAGLNQLDEHLQTFTFELQKFCDTNLKI